MAKASATRTNSARHRYKFRHDREKLSILGLVLGFGSFFGLIFGFFADWDSGLTGLAGFGIILGVLSFLSLVDKHMHHYDTGPEVDLSTLLFITMSHPGERKVIG